MAQYLRSAKSAKKWTDAELTAYNISITPASPADFFVTGADPSLDHLNPAILTTNADDLLHSTGSFLASLDFAIRMRDNQALDVNQHSAIIDFSTATLSLLNFDNRQCPLSIRHIIRLKICGEYRGSQADVCLVYPPHTIHTILLVLVKVLSETTGNVEAQVIAQAIAAYQSNNTNRAAEGKSVLEAMTIPCIAMYHTIPNFYLVPVTRELSDAVGSGQYPTTQTRVLKCATVAANERQARDGMADKELRKVALKRFLAFKNLAESHWQHFID